MYKKNDVERKFKVAQNQKYQSRVHKNCTEEQYLNFDTELDFYSKWILVPNIIITIISVSLI